MNEEYYKLLIDESYDQIRKYYIEAQNPFVFFSHISSIRDAAERKLDRIEERFKSNISKIFRMIGNIVFTPNKNKRSQKGLNTSPPIELLENFKDYSLWRSLQEDDKPMDKYLQFFKSCNISTENIGEYTDAIQDFERQLETGLKTYRIYIACTLALDLILEQNLAYKPLPDLKDIDEDILRNLSGAAYNKQRESQEQFELHIDNLVDVIHGILQTVSLNEQYSENGNIKRKFLNRVHRKHIQQQDLSEHTLRNWFNHPTKRKIINDRLKKLT